jgi:nitrate/TMAO reductase-like tetraheme cytochrome c subunit
MANTGTSCVSCHKNDPIADVHNGNCLICHANTTPAGIHTLVGSAAGHNITANHPQNTCTDCHSTYANRPSAHFDNRPGQNDGDIRRGRHMRYIDSITPGCLQCHFDTAFNPNDPAYTPPDAWTLDPFSYSHNASCLTCHTNAGDYTLKGSAASKGTGKPLSSGPGCESCHPQWDWSPSMH